jgi:tetratricopeptide (TPR) repeat protein
VTTDDQPAGVWQRVAAAGGDLWNADDVRIWDYPESRLTAHGQMNRLDLDSLDGLLLPFRAYLNVTIDERTGRPVLADRELMADRAGDKDFHPGVHINVRMTKGEQMRARLTHLEGNYAQAIQSYTDVRLKCMEVLRANPPAAERIMHSRAKDDALYWTGLCKFEQGEFKEAVVLFQRYLKQPEAANWLRESRLLLAASLAKSGDYRAAIAQLEEVPADDLEVFGNCLRIRQWQAAETRAQ